MRSLIVKNAVVFLTAALVATVLAHAYSHGLEAASGRWYILAACIAAFLALLWANGRSFAEEHSAAKRGAMLVGATLMILPFCLYFAAMAGGFLYTTLLSGH